MLRVGLLGNDTPPRATPNAQLTLTAGRRSKMKGFFIMKHTKKTNCPVFLKYLSEVLPENEHVIVQEMLGYLLVPSTAAKKAFILVGEPASGKSTLLYVIKDLLLRRENVSNLSWQQLDNRFDVGQLYGKLANISEDLHVKTIKSMQKSGGFKCIVSGDYIVAEQRRKDPHRFKPFSRLLFSCSNMPNMNTDHADGFYSRLCLIRFENTIPADKMDMFLKEKLAAEDAGILEWAMAGLKRLMDNDFKFTA
jgi:putative DNA primase/helicase